MTTDEEMKAMITTMTTGSNGWYIKDENKHKESIKLLVRPIVKSVKYLEDEDLYEVVEEHRVRCSRSIFGSSKS